MSVSARAVATLCGAVGIGLVAAVALGATAETGEDVAVGKEAPVGRDTAADEVLEVIRAFNEAFAANDPERYFRFVDPEIVVLTPSSPYRVEGRADDREEFEWGLRTGRSRVGYFQELQPLVRLHGDVAVVTYYSRGSYGPDEAVAYLKETDVLVRRGDGCKIVHIHVSSTSP